MQNTLFVSNLNQQRLRTNFLKFGQKINVKVSLSTCARIKLKSAYGIKVINVYHG